MKTINSYVATAIGAVCFCAVSAAFTAAGAADYPSGYTALERFDAEGQAGMPPILQAWLITMLAAFALGLIFVIWRPIARVAVGGFLIGLFAGEPVANALGVPYLSGFISIVHVVCWSPALLMLLAQRPFMKERNFYGIWTGFLTAVIVISFYFDIRDAAIYVDHVAGLGLLS